jgi:hypothetical protein
MPHFSDVGLLIGFWFSYDIDYYDEEGTRLSAEFVAILKGEDRV